MLKDPELDTWAVVEFVDGEELIGHVTEERHFGNVMGRLDIPVNPDDQDDELFVSRYFTAASVYALSPMSEEAARATASLGTYDDEDEPDPEDDDEEEPEYYDDDDEDYDPDADEIGSGWDGIRALNEPGDAARFHNVANGDPISAEILG